MPFYSNASLFVKQRICRGCNLPGSCVLCLASKLDNGGRALLESGALKRPVGAAHKILALERSPYEEDTSLAFTAPEAVERRVLRNTVAVVAMATVAAALLADWRFVLGLVLGGGLALLNYKWLNSSLRGIVGAGNAKAPPGTMIKFVVRWLVIAALAWAANRTGYVDAVAILAGLFAPAVAILIEGAYVAYRTTRTRGER